MACPFKALFRRPYRGFFRALFGRTIISLTALLRADGYEMKILVRGGAVGIPGINEHGTRRGTRYRCRLCDAMLHGRHHGRDITECGAEGDRVLAGSGVRHGPSRARQVRSVE